MRPRYARDCPRSRLVTLEVVLVPVIHRRISADGRATKVRVHVVVVVVVVPAKVVLHPLIPVDEEVVVRPIVA